MNLYKFKKEFPVSEKFLYFDHAAVGPLPLRSLRAVNNFNEQKLFGNLHWQTWDDVLGEVRNVIAKFISGNEGEIALTCNTSEGLGIIANGVNWEKQDNIVTTDLEFPSSLFTSQNISQRHHIDLRIVKNIDGALPLDEYINVIDKRTKLVVLSHVQFSNGFKTDLRSLSDIAHENGAMVLVDGIQSVGSMPFDVKKERIDFLTTGGYKWLLSPFSVGFLYIKKERLDKIIPSVVGYRSDKEVYNLLFRQLNLSDNARRFEHGHRNFPGFAAMVESLNLLLEVGLKNIKKQIWTLNDRIIEGSEELGIDINTPLSPENRSGIINLNINHPERVEKVLLKQSIVISVRNGVRISPHFYNTLSEVEKLLLLLEKSI